MSNWRFYLIFVVTILLSTNIIICTSVSSSSNEKQSNLSNTVDDKAVELKPMQRLDNSEEQQSEVVKSKESPAGNFKYYFTFMTVSSLSVVGIIIFKTLRCVMISSQKNVYLLLSIFVCHSFLDWENHELNSSMEN
jgi:hypothetical protein